MSHDLEVMFRSLQGSLQAHRPHLGSTSDELERAAVPVALLTGFLGAGKSTLLCGLLADPPAGLTVRAVVNDVGSLPFDPTMVADRNDLEIELTNGCGCCEDPGDLAETLAKLAKSTPDLIVLEASGLADPFALAQVVEADPGLDLDRIVAVVDGQSVVRHLDGSVTGPVLERQIEAAHVVVVSHADQLSPADLQAAIDCLAIVAPGRIIASSTLTRPTVDMLLPGSMRGAALPADSTPPGHDLVTVTAEQSGPMLSSEIDDALRGFPSAIYRCKGLLETPDGPVLVQATSTGWESDASSFGCASDHRWFGVTVVGADADAVGAAVASLGCGTHTEPADHTNP